MRPRICFASICSSGSPWNSYFSQYRGARSKASKSLCRDIDGGGKKEKITFNKISPAFTGHSVQQSSLCSLRLGDKDHYIIGVHCVLSVGPLPGCWEWISWALCPYSKATLFKVKSPNLITPTTYVGHRFPHSITSAIKIPFKAWDYLPRTQRFSKNEARKTQWGDARSHIRSIQYVITDSKYRTWIFHMRGGHSSPCKDHYTFFFFFLRRASHTYRFLKAGQWESGSRECSHHLFVFVS